MKANVAAASKTVGTMESSRENNLAFNMAGVAQYEASKMEESLTAAYNEWKVCVREIRVKLKCDCTASDLCDMIDVVEKLRSPLEASYNDLRSQVTPSQLICRKIEACTAVTADLVRLMRLRLSEDEETPDLRVEKIKLRTLLDSDYARSRYASKVSDTSSISAKRVEAAAELAAKRAKIQLQATIDAQSLQLKELESQRDLKIMEARLRAYEDEELKGKDRHGPVCREVRDYGLPTHPTTVQEEQVSKSETSSAQAIQESVSLSQLPAPEPTAFYSDPLPFKVRPHLPDRGASSQGAPREKSPETKHQKTLETAMTQQADTSPIETSPLLGAAGHVQRFGATCAMFARLREESRLAKENKMTLERSRQMNKGGNLSVTSPIWSPASSSSASPENRKKSPSQDSPGPASGDHVSKSQIFETRSIVYNRPLTANHISDPTGMEPHRTSVREAPPATPAVAIRALESDLLTDIKPEESPADHASGGLEIEELLVGDPEVKTVQVLRTGVLRSVGSTDVRSWSSKWTTAVKVTAGIFQPETVKVKESPRNEWKLTKFLEAYMDDGPLRRGKLQVGERPLAKKGERDKKTFIIESDPFQKLVILVERAQ